MLDLPSRIERVGELAGRRSASRLIAAYGHIYFLSSEIIHGSPFGASYFYTAYKSGKASGEASTEEFIVGTVRQLEDILVAVLHASCGFLAAFFEIQKMAAPSAVEQKLFDRLVDLFSKNASEFPKEASGTATSTPER